MNNKLTITKDIKKTLIHTAIAFVCALVGSFFGATYLVKKTDESTALKLSYEEVERVRRAGGAVLVESKVGNLLISASPDKK